jgi:hypothetical protein
MGAVDAMLTMRASASAGTSSLENRRTLRRLSSSADRASAVGFALGGGRGMRSAADTPRPATVALASGQPIMQ